MTLLDMENKEGILLALNSLDKDSNSSTPAILEEYIKQIAKHGLTFIPWIHIKPLILRKFDQVMEDFFEEIDENFRPRLAGHKSLSDLRQYVRDSLMNFEGTPFTIQRLSELLTQPRKHYTRPDKYLRGFEKACLVVSTIDCFGNKIHNIDPRFSGDFGLEDSLNVNGSVAGGSTGSVDESLSLPKRSDEEDDEEDEDGFSKNSEISWQTTIPRINFHVPLVSSTVEASERLSFPLKEATDEGAVMQHNDHVSSCNSPGKQLPFLASSNVEIPDNTSGIDGQSNEEWKEDSQVLTIQKLFTETETPSLDLSKINATVIGGGVPPIDQMLRPMGQLEAFVNTISMDTATTESNNVTTTTVIAVTTENNFPKISHIESSPFSSEQIKTTTVIATTETIVEILSSNQLRDEIANNSIEESEKANGHVHEKQALADQAEHMDATPRKQQIVPQGERLSTKRESPVFDDDDDTTGPCGQIDTDGSPAKRPRLVFTPLNISLPDPPAVLPTDVFIEDEHLEVAENISESVENAGLSTPQLTSLTLDQESGELVSISAVPLPVGHSVNETVQRDSETGEKESS